MANQDAPHTLQIDISQEEDEEEDEIEEEEEEEEEEGEEHRGDAWKCGNGTCSGATSVRGWGGGWLLGDVLDPRSKWIQEWSRAFLLVSATGLAVDPLFFYTLSISDTCMCLFIDGWFAITVTILRSMTDALHVWNMWLQLKMAYAAPDCAHTAIKENTRLNSRRGAVHYLKSKTGFILDLFVVLPVPQAWKKITALMSSFNSNHLYFVAAVVAVAVFFSACDAHFVPTAIMFCFLPLMP